MKKSQCYRACRGEDKELLFILTDTRLEVVTDENGNSYNIHFHKLDKMWSATEENSGMLCVPGRYVTLELCYEAVLRCRNVYKRALSTEYSMNIQNKLKEFKESLI